MNKKYIHNLAYYSVILILLYTIPQMIKIIKYKQHYYITNTSIYLNIFLFGVFTIYAKSYDDNILVFLYFIMFIIYCYILYLKIVKVDN